ncbi:MAG: 16S rRNA (adenine(1518)-N(6)/adenine(1519)-N(6))-dimethyltransferase RsmA [Bacilli bacterium]|nr:16S rRNA (adenine(1518)-N(6)/adenine(1519)-N(6))-dimethyltransferase RsmA [Bacilli bacterium]
MSKIGTINQTKDTIRSSDFKVKKKFGQNFLIDQNILVNIVKIPSISKETLVIEIGPGLGGLTEHLIEKSAHVLAYEIDPDLVKILKNTFSEKDLTLINMDFLKCNIDEDIMKITRTFDKVILVANLPYYITTPIILKIIEESNIIKEITVMTQLEVAKRITSSPSTKDYNSLSVAIQYKTNAIIAMKVPRNAFIPAPNVDSAIVKLDVIDNIELKPKSESHFYNLVRASFVQRRKTLLNNIHAKYGLEKDKIVEYLQTLGLDPQIRAENLSVSDFIALSDFLLNLQIK